jgi:hypothetical protein
MQFQVGRIEDPAETVLNVRLVIDEQEFVHRVRPSYAREITNHQFVMPANREFNSWSVARRKHENTLS